MADQRLIPAGIRDAGAVALNELIDRIGTVDISPVLIYWIEEVVASALPHLIEQFHVAGWEGGAQALNDDQRRALIKRAIELHRRKGTPWAVKQALEATGQRVYLTEWFDQVPPGAPYTAQAEVEVRDRPLTDASIAAVEAAIAEWKPVRTHITTRVLATTSVALNCGVICSCGEVITIYPITNQGE